MATTEDTAMMLNAEKDLTFQVLRLLGVTPRSAEDLLRGRRKEAVDKSQKVLEDSGHAFGSSIFQPIFAADAQASYTKWFYVLLTAILVGCVPFMASLLRLAHGTASSSARDHAHFLESYTETLSLTEAQLLLNLQVAVAVFALFVVAHFSNLSWPARWYCSTENKYATSCYDEMFAEPLASLELVSRGRGRRLIARWGNTLSNMSYLFAGLCVSRSVLHTWAANKYALADALFAANLLLLTVFSTLWHSTNYNKVCMLCGCLHCPFQQVFSITHTNNTLTRVISL